MYIPYLQSLQCYHQALDYILTERITDNCHLVYKLHFLNIHIFCMLKLMSSRVKNIVNNINSTRVMSLLGCCAKGHIKKMKE